MKGPPRSSALPPSRDTARTAFSFWINPEPMAKSRSPGWRGRRRRESRLGGRAEQRPRQHEERPAGGVDHLTAQFTFEDVVGREDVEQFHPEVRGDGGARGAPASLAGDIPRTASRVSTRGTARGGGRARRRGAATERGREGRERGRGTGERRGASTRRDVRCRGASRTTFGWGGSTAGTRDDGSTGDVADARGAGARADGRGGEDGDAASRERGATRGEVAELGRRRDGGARRSDVRDDGCHQPIGESRGRRRALTKRRRGQAGSKDQPVGPSRRDADRDARANPKTRPRCASATAATARGARRTTLRIEQRATARSALALVRSGLRNRCHASSDRRFSCSSDQFRAAHGHRHRRRRTRGLRANDEHHPRHHTPSFASSDARSYSIRPASSSLTRRPPRHSPRPRPRPPRRPRLPAPPGRSPRGRR